MVTVETSYEPDDCCGRRIAKALLKDELDSETRWECPKCGLEWRPDIVMATVDGETREIRHWRPRPVLIVM